MPGVDAPATSTFAELRAQAFLAEVGRRLAGALNQRRCQRAVVELAVSALADAAAVLGPPGQPFTPVARLVAGRQVEEDAVHEDRVGEVPGLVEALAGAPSLSSRALAAAELPSWLLPRGVDGVGQALLLPLPGSVASGSALLLIQRAGEAGFSPEQTELARTFAARAGAALSATALYRQQADAMTVLQEDLLPPELPRIEGVELAGSYQPAEYGLMVGGDFYDVLPAGGSASETVVVLGDVCGKGARAAVLTGRVRQALRALHLVRQDPTQLLTVLNEALQPLGGDGEFVTLVVGTLARVGDRVRLEFATGGHPAPLVVRHVDGAVTEVPTAGTLLGVVPDAAFHQASVTLGPGDLCLLYSDGVTEARGGASGKEEYGERRLREALATCRGMPAGAAVERIRQLVSDWIHGGVRDDIAMLAIRAAAR